MNKQEIGQLLTLAAGFDNRKVDRVSVEAWALIPDIANGDYEDAKAAVVAHQTGPNRHEYLTVGHIIDALQEGCRNSLYEIEADVRSAKARKLISADWPTRQPLPDDTRQALAEIRARENRQANAHLALEVPSDAPVDLGHVGRRLP